MAAIPKPVQEILNEITDDDGVRRSLKPKLLKICNMTAYNISYSTEEQNYLNEHQNIFTKIKNLMIQCRTADAQYHQYCYGS